MMGDYLEFSLTKAAEYGFAQIHFAGMWAKIVKAALAIPQTHVRHGALEARDTAHLLQRLGLAENRVEEAAAANTAREIYYQLRGAGEHKLIRAVCAEAKAYGERCSGLKLQVYLVTAEEGVVEHCK